jgi:hypothetical protein
VATENEGHRAREIRTSPNDKMPKLAAKVGPSLHFPGDTTCQAPVWKINANTIEFALLKQKT